MNEVIEITLTENINSNINKINIKMPLAISLLDRKKGEIVKFQNDNAEEIYIEILEVNNLNNIKMEVKTYFKIAKNWYGKKMKIRVQFNTGNYVNNIYEYDHDELYEICISYLEDLDCWKNDDCYSSSKNIPGFALPFVKQIK